MICRSATHRVAPFSRFSFLIPFHLAANSIGEPQRFRISAEGGTADHFECALERDAMADRDVDGTFAARRSPRISAHLTSELDRRRSPGRSGSRSHPTDDRMLRHTNRWEVESAADITRDAETRRMKTARPAHTKNVRSPRQAPDGR